MVIYADAVFVLNTALNWMLLRSAARLRGSFARSWRLMLGAAIGGGYAVAAVLPPLGWLNGFWGKSLFLVLMVGAAFGFKRASIAAGAVFVLLSVGLCGAMFAVLTLVFQLRPNVAGFYPATFPELLLTCALSSAGLRLILQKWAIRPGEAVVPIQITLSGRTLTLSAFRDTGNSLTDPVSSRPVPVVEATALSRLLGAAATAAVVRGDLTQAMVLLAAHKPRLIPFRTVGSRGGMLAAVFCEEVVIGRVKLQNQYIALSPTPVCDRGDYHALIGGKL